VIVLAALLLIVVALLVAFVLTAGVDASVVLSSDWLNVEWDAPVPWLFLLGAVALFLAEIALAMLRSGARRGVNRRRELKRLREAERGRAAAPAGAPAAEGAVAEGAAAPADAASSEPVGRGSVPSTHEPDSDQRGTWHDDPSSGRHATP
jgi:hypothetical protein